MVDRNADNINDLFLYYEKSRLVKIEEDLNNDKKIDYITKFFEIKKSYAKFQDTNFDGKFNRVITYKIQPENQIEVLYEIDNNKDGHYEVSYTQFNKLAQNNEDCYKNILNKKINSFAKLNLDIISYQKSGFYSTGFGYQIEKKCMKRWGNNFVTLVKDSMQTGLSCLKKLHGSQKQKNISGALKNAYGISTLLKKDDVKIVCSEQNYYWGGVAAHASTYKEEMIEELNIKHPFISINTNKPASVGTPSSLELSNMKQTIFHEQIHNLGIRHKEDIEFPYACTTCCFSKIKGKEKDVACKICTGNYKNEVDKSYIKDIVDYTLLKEDGLRGADSAVKYMKENPTSLFGVSMLAKANSEKFNPLGPEIAKMVILRVSSRSNEERTILKDSLKFQNKPEYIGTEQTTKTIANVLYELYYEKNPFKALEYLEKNKDILKKELTIIDVNIQKPALWNQKQLIRNRVREKLSEVLSQVLYDMSMNGYPNDIKEIESYKKRAFKIQLDF